MSRTVIAPIVSVLILFVELVFGIKISDELGGQITEWLVVGASLGGVVYGIIKNHQKEKPPTQ